MGENSTKDTKEEKNERFSLDDFVFEIADHLIAQEPLFKRDASRMIVRYFDGNISHKSIQDFPSELPKGSLVIFNDSKVIPARLLGFVDKSRVEVFLLEKEGLLWKALGKPMRKLKRGTKIDLSGGVIAVIEDEEPGDSPSIRISFNLDEEDLARWIEENGYIPLPPYISRKDPVRAPNSLDRERYQTIYANKKGSVAAPTAGLHFSESLLFSLQKRDISVAFVTLHVGGGTFLPVKSKELSKHKMHREKFVVPADTLRIIKEKKALGLPIVAVGTTTFRCLESFELREEIEKMDIEKYKEEWKETDLFIFPKKPGDIYKSQLFDAILTNFHQPGSTLFMLIAALIELKEARHLYSSAIKESYRFFSYGDASFLWLK